MSDIRVLGLGSGTLSYRFCVWDQRECRGRCLIFVFWDWDQELWATNPGIRIRGFRRWHLRFMSCDWIRVCGRRRRRFTSWRDQEFWATDHGIRIRDFRRRHLRLDQVEFVGDDVRNSCPDGIRNSELQILWLKSGIVEDEVWATGPGEDHDCWRWQWS